MTSLPTGTLQFLHKEQTSKEQKKGKDKTLFLHPTNHFSAPQLAKRLKLFHWNVYGHVSLVTDIMVFLENSLFIVFCIFVFCIYFLFLLYFAIQAELHRLFWKKLKKNCILVWTKSQRERKRYVYKCTQLNVDIFEDCRIENQLLFQAEHTRITALMASDSLWSLLTSSV